MIATTERNKFLETVTKGKVIIASQSLDYIIYSVDARSYEQRSNNQANHCLDGNLNIFIPGHGQKAWTAKELLRTIALKTSSHLVWSVDIAPPVGGDPVRCVALIAILKEQTTSILFSSTKVEAGSKQYSRISLFGWSHGGGEVLRAAELDPDLFEEVIALCPAGLVERRCIELVWSFTWECLHIFFYTLIYTPRRLLQVLRLMGDILSSMFEDIVNTGSLKQVITDICWICHKIIGTKYLYPGSVIILFSEQDKVIRWQDVFPYCHYSGEIAERLSEYQKANFPCVKKLVINVLDGNHASPETMSEAFVDRALRDLGHIDRFT